MRIILTTALALVTSLCASAAIHTSGNNPKDTLIVKRKNQKGKIQIITDDSTSVESLRSVDLNEIIRQLAEDQSRLQNAKGPKEVEELLKSQSLPDGRLAKLGNLTVIPSDTLWQQARRRAEKAIEQERSTGAKNLYQGEIPYQIPNPALDNNAVSLRGMVGSRAFQVRNDSLIIYRPGENGATGYSYNYSWPQAAPKAMARPYEAPSIRYVREKTISHRFDVDLGLNTYFEDGDVVNSNRPYALDPLGSRYFSLRLLQQARLNHAPALRDKKELVVPQGTPVTGLRKTKIYAIYGFEVAWNNYMYESDLRLKKINGENTFVEAPADVDPRYAYNKSKLTVVSLNVPVMLYFKFNNGMRLGAGGWAGYRLGSYTKVRYDHKGDTFREREWNNFNLNNFSYGSRIQVGFRGVDIFCNYHLNSLFASGNNPNLNAMSFGVEF